MNEQSHSVPADAEQPTATLTCPDCKGHKGGVGLFCGQGVSYQKWTPCSSCKGTGSVTKGHAARIERGERLRRDRIDRDTSLREEAKRLNISPVELSHIEQGRESETPEGVSALSQRLVEMS